MLENIRLVICPDFGQAYIWCYATTPDGKPYRSCGYGPVWDKSIPTKHSVDKYLDNEFLRWQRGFENAPHVGGDNPMKLDWRRFHAEGLGLARRLKEIVGDKARVIYVKPIEDSDHKFLEHQEILLGGEILDVPGIR